MYDAIIAGGKVIDGSGSPAFDAEGRVVAPGFIDSHCHSELALIAKPTTESKTHQVLF